VAEDRSVVKSKPLEVTTASADNRPGPAGARLALVANQQMLEYRMDAYAFSPTELGILVKRQVPGPPNSLHLAQHTYRGALQCIKLFTRGF